MYHIQRKMTSNISSPSSSKDSSINSQNKTNDADDFKEKTESNLCPFKLLWSFGINSEVPIINLTTENRTIIAYACSHAVIIYNYESKDVVNLQGHQNEVKTISISTNGKWLLSGDFDKDSVIVIWDTETGVPICTLFHPHGEHEMTAARISPNAKYVVTIGNEINQKVHFWLWTYGKDEPDGIMELIEISGDRVKDIAFNEDLPEEFVLTADANVVFCKWENNELARYYPQIFGNALRYGYFNYSCFISKSHRVVTSSTNGYILLWSIVSGTERSHVKSVRLHKCSITALIHHDGLIVIGTAGGRICFYDIELKILYACQNSYLDCIQSISFELRTSLLAPVPVVSESELEFNEKDSVEYEGEFEGYSESKLEDSLCDEKIGYLKKIESLILEEVESSATVNLEPMLRNHNRDKENFTKSIGPIDTTLEGSPFYTDNFIVSSLNGSIALIDIPSLKCKFIFQDTGGLITSLDAHPRSDFIVTGNAHGLLCLYDYKKRKVILRRKTPPLPDLNLLIEHQVKCGHIVYSTCPQNNEKLTAITVLKYSPVGDLLACGLENGVLWMLHPITLDPLDEIPYKHSAESIHKLIFTECAEYMAYSDNTQVIAVFKRNHQLSFGNYLWHFLGKYRVHDGVIRDLLFGPATCNSVVPRLFSLGEDKNLIEYNLEDSGPYPDPGLLIAEIYQIEYTAIPLCLAWYPELGIEKFLMISNSEYKYRLLNDQTKMIRGTFLGPLFNTPVRYLKVIPGMELKGGGYIIFATEKEIGLQIYPFDGNPYKILGMIGHPRKVTNISINSDGNILFTSGHNDHCVLMWKIKCRSVDVLARLGGESLNPYYCLIQGGKTGWFINEMRDFFYYAQILQQGENTIAIRTVSETISIKQITNLMRAVGYYPSNEEIEIFMGEISYRNYADTGQLVEEVTFEEFVKLYINHRPAFGISMHQLQEAFQIFSNPHRRVSLKEENPVMTRDRFVKILFGEGPEGMQKDTDNLFGEPLTSHEAFIYLTFLINSDEHLEDLFYRDKDTRTPSMEFTFLPERISYKDFITDIMGIESPEETRADDD
nr:cilia- and flagella-associated protein 251-like isoform X1 [Osmia lignaria]